MRLMLQINLVLEIMAHRNGCLWIVATFRSRSGCSNVQRRKSLSLLTVPFCYRDVKIVVFNHLNENVLILNYQVPHSLSAAFFVIISAS